MRTLSITLVLLMVSTAAWADEVTDRLEAALKLHKQGKEIRAKAEIEKALTAVTPLAKAQIPKPRVTAGTYVNYEHNFRVTRPDKNWKFGKITSSSTSTMTSSLCTIWLTKSGRTTDNTVILYARDLKARLGGRYKLLKGHELEFLKKAGKTMSASVSQLKDVKVTDQSVMKVAGYQAVRTDYTALKGRKQMKCFSIDVMRGHMMFTGIFIRGANVDAAVIKGFKSIVESIDLSPVPAPADDDDDDKDDDKDDD